MAEPVLGIETGLNKWNTAWLADSHVVPWLTNIQAETFSVYTGNARSSCLVVGAVASRSTHAGLRHWNLDQQSCCASVERSTSWRRLNVAGGDQCPSQQF